VAGLALALPSPAASQANPYDEELRRLASDPVVQAAMDFLEETDDRTIADLIRLTEIPAPPFMEDARGQAFLEMLLEVGVDTAYVDEVGNVIGVRRGTVGDRTLAIAAHLDTVFPEGTDVTTTVRGDTIFAPGVADDTRGLAAVLALLRTMNENQIRTEYDLLFIGNVGEEGLGDLRGVKHLFGESGPGIDYFISIDGTSDSRVTHMGLGSHRFRVTFRGPGGHSWGAFGLGNPAHAMGMAIERFVERAETLTRSGPRTSYNVGRIGGGTSVNSVPFEAWMEVDMRSESPESLLTISNAFREAVEQALIDANAIRRRGDELTADVDMIGNRPSGEIPVDEPFVQRGMAATRVLGLEPEPGRSSTDSNIPISMGIPAFTIGGGGNGVGAHSLNEFFVNTNGPRGIQRALLIVLAQAGLVQVS
jgi:acetylornithine deacetylase/succinyl-diaminopimelate desuccinylase-like protein